VPVVFISIVLGVVGVGDPKTLGSLGIKTIAFYLATTAIAITIAIIIALVLQPGEGQAELLDSSEVEEYRETALGGDTGEAIDQTVDETIINLIPSNVVEAMGTRSEEHTSELQSRFDLVCRLRRAKSKY